LSTHKEKIPGNSLQKLVRTLAIWFLLNWKENRHTMQIRQL